jgi:3-oxoacyl-[acyl-carrier protein] reductase
VFDLTGKVAVVTGASRGLGREDALTLARLGADVVITDVLIEDDPELSASVAGGSSVLQQVAAQQGWVFSNRTAEEIRQRGRRSVAIKMDVTDREQVAAVFARVREEFGRIDILVNNAAVLDNVAPLHKMDYRLWDRDLAVNLTGAFNCTKEVWPYMREQRWGRVVFMASIAGTEGGFGQASYSATKAAVIALAKTAALEGGRYGITANAVAPGIAGSEAANMAAEFRKAEYDRFREASVFKRFGTPAEVAAAVAFLCTEEAGYITGTVLEVTGGMNLFTASLPG